jgi:peptidoglycan-associated lipoprotein
MLKKNQADLAAVVVLPRGFLLKRTLMMQSNKNTRYFAFGLAGSLILGGFIFFLTKGEDADKNVTPETVVEEQVVTKTESPVAEKADRLAGIARSGFFAYDSAELDSSAMTTLGAWAEKLAEDKSVLLNIEGYCDERGSEAYNLKLGKKRAEAVKAFLVSKGVEASRLHTISFGESSPLAIGHSESAWSQNRRFDLKEVTTFAQR